MGSASCESNDSNSISDRTPRTSPDSVGVFVFSANTKGRQTPSPVSKTAYDEPEAHASIEADAVSVLELSPPHHQVPLVSVSASSENDPSTQREPMSPRGEDSANISGRLANMRFSREPDTLDEEPRVSESLLDLDSINEAVERLEMRSDTQNGSPVPQTSLRVSRLAARRRSSPRASQACHMVEDEELPNDKFNTASFQGSLAATKQLMCDLRSALGSSSIHLQSESAMKSLHERADKLACFRPPCTRTVGFVGDTGVGMLLTYTIW